MELGRRRGRVELGKGQGGGMIMDRLALQPVADSSSNPEQFTYAFICGFEAYTLVDHTSLQLYRIPLNSNTNHITYNDFILSRGIQGGYCCIQLQNGMACRHLTVTTCRKIILILFATMIYKTVLQELNFVLCKNAAKLMELHIFSFVICMKCFP